MWPPPRALDLAVRAGLDPDRSLELLRSGVGSSRILELRGPLMAQRVYEPATMKLGLWQKDLDLIAHFAAGVGAPATLFKSTLARYSAAIAAGHGAEDTAAVFEVIRSQ